MMVKFDPTSLQVKGGTGKNFCVNNKQLVCFLSISQYPICGNGERSVAFWQCIAHHYNKHKLVEGI
jgi:hypothetical protein